MERPAVLLFVEDPGAANYLAPLAPALTGAGLDVRFVAAGAAAGYLRERAVAVVELPRDAPLDGLLAAPAPRLLVTGTSEDPDAVGLALIAAARARGIPTVGAVDGPANSAFRFRGRGEAPLALAPDWIAVADESTLDGYRRLGFPEERLVVCGHPHFDVVRRRGDELRAEGRAAIRSRLLPAAAGRKAVVFIAEISGGLNAAQFRRSPEYTLAGRGAELRTEVVLDELLDGVGRLPQRPYLVLRLHPKNRPADFERYLSAFDLVSQSEPALDLVFAADLVAGMTSMLLLEAALMERPTLSIVPRPLERDWLPSIAWGATACAYERAGVQGELARLLGPDAPAEVRIPTGMVPERSTARAAAFIRALIEGRHAKQAAHEA